MTPADLPIRLLARFLDAIVVAVLQALLGQLMGFGFDWLIVGALLAHAYFFVCDARFGGSPAKLLLGMRVIGPDGGNPTLEQAARREAFVLLGAIPFVGPVLAFAAWAWIGWDIAGHTIRTGPHDEFAGGTRVVRAER
ncbi:MAG: RDD family protein [Myxococcota bacterium]